MRLPAKLIGGRFDGDQGMMCVTQVPDFIWAFDCPNTALCPYGPVHWAYAEPGDVDHELYVHSGFDAAEQDTPGMLPTAIYVVAGMDDPSRLPGVGELAHA